MILSYLYFKAYFQKFQVLVSCCFSVSGKTGRPDRSTGACVRTCTLVHVCRPTAGSTDCLQFALGFSGSTARSTAFRKLCFCLEDGRPERSTRAQRLLPAGRTADRTGRPPSLQSPNGSFLFGEILKIYFWSVLKQIFSDL